MKPTRVVWTEIRADYPNFDIYQRLSPRLMKYILANTKSGLYHEQILQNHLEQCPSHKVEFLGQFSTVFKPKPIDLF